MNAKDDLTSLRADEGVASVRLVLSGCARILRGATAVPLDRKSAGLLCFLAYEGPTSRRRLAAMLWPEAGPSTARNNLAQLLRRLRQKLAGLSVVSGVMQLRLADSLRVDPAPGAGGHGEPSMGEADDLLGGYDFADCPSFDGWLQLQRDRLAFDHQAALEALSAAAEGAGDLRLALAYAQRLVTEHRYCEAGHRRLICVLWQAGDRNAALAAFRRCRDLLRNELGVEPAPETVALERRILSSHALAIPS